MYALLTNNTISYFVEMATVDSATEANNAICNNKNYFDKLCEKIYGKNKHGEYVGKSYIGPFFL
jgi:hypothetical protein